ncbi:MFS transporter [bacterium]|nr:MFS transporter [bacterium]
MPSLFLLVIAYLGFISLGLPDSILGVVWPSVYPHFGLTAGHLGVVLTATVSGYLVSSLLAGRVLQLLGVGGLLAASCALVSVSLAGFALAPVWLVFVGSAVIAGLGAGAIDSGLNAYAARHFSARQMNWLHACWGVGATLSAMTAAALLARHFPWQWTYGSLCILMVGMTALFTLSLNAWQRSPEPTAESPGPALSAQDQVPATMREALRHPLVIAQVVVFFVYSGFEMTAANWSYTLLTQYRELSEGLAGTAVSLFWVSLTAGRFLLGAIADQVGVRRLLIRCVTAGLLGGLCFVLAPWPWVCIMGLAVLGASLAPLYPGMMTLTPRHLGRLAEHAVGFQVGGAMLGQVSIPSLGGVLLVAYGPAALNGLVGVMALLLWLAIMGLLWAARREKAV